MTNFNDIRAAVDEGLRYMDGVPVELLDQEWRRVDVESMKEHLGALTTAVARSEEALRNVIPVAMQGVANAGNAQLKFNETITGTLQQDPSSMVVGAMETADALKKEGETTVSVSSKFTRIKELVAQLNPLIIEVEVGVGQGMDMNDLANEHMAETRQAAEDFKNRL